MQDGGPILSPGAWVADGHRVIAHLNRSATMDVYQAWSETLTARVIAKRLRPDAVGTGPEAWLTQEGQLLLVLAHPHLVRAWELTASPDDPADPVLILETLVGQTLERLLVSGALRLAWPDLCMLGLQTASVIRYLHSRGVLHMDLTPKNLIADQGLVKVIDLSLAAPPGAPGDVGTPAYRPPESWLGATAAPAADTWGIGCLLWEAAAGRYLFEPAPDAPPPQLQGRAPTIRRHRRLPAALAEVIDACLEPDPAARPSVEQVHDTLATLVGEPRIG